MANFQRVRRAGVTFVFKTDPDDPALLHIWARHLTTPDDVTSVWFDTSASQSWNAQHRRFERQNTTHCLYWFWIDEPGQVVMVISCFTV